MKILHVASSETSGAGRAALRLHEGLLNNNIDSNALVLYKKSPKGLAAHRDRQSIEQVDKKARIYKQVQDKLSKRITQKVFGCDHTFSANFTPSLILDDIKAKQADVINLHWIGREFIKIEELQEFNTPIVWTLQDMWSFTGGCHYSETCDRYTESCGSCPQLEGDKEQDLSRWIWQRKAKAWKDLNLTIVAPGTWIAECARASSLFGDRRIEVIPFALDTEVYKPVEPQAARKLLNLPQDKQLILFGAFSSTSDKRKGFHLLVPALQKLSQTDLQTNAELVIFGADEPKDPVDLGFKTHYLGRFDDEVALSQLYSAADVMIVPSIQESFGQTASESLACGTPVVAFNATGQRDIVEHQDCGYLAQPYEVEDLAQGIAWVLQDTQRHQQLRLNARAKAIATYALDLQAQSYLSLYQELLATSQQQQMPQPVTVS